MEILSYSQQAINAVNKGDKAFCKFLSANDTGLTGGHQSGIYIAKMQHLSCSIRQVFAVKIKRRLLKLNGRMIS